MSLHPIVSAFVSFFFFFLFLSCHKKSGGHLHPLEAGNIGNLGGGGGHGAAEGRDGLVHDLVAVEAVGPLVNTDERVAGVGGAGAAGAGGNGGRGRSSGARRRRNGRVDGGRRNGRRNGSRGRAGQTLAVPVVLVRAGAAGLAASRAAPAITSALAPRDVCQSS